MGGAGRWADVLGGKPRLQLQRHGMGGAWSVQGTDQVSRRGGGAVALPSRRSRRSGLGAGRRFGLGQLHSARAAAEPGRSGCAGIQSQRIRGLQVKWNSAVANWGQENYLIVSPANLCSHDFVNWPSLQPLVACRTPPASRLTLALAAGMKSRTYGSTAGSSRAWPGSGRHGVSDWAHGRVAGMQANSAWPDSDRGRQQSVVEARQPLVSTHGRAVCSPGGPKGASWQWGGTSGPPSQPPRAGRGAQTTRTAARRPAG